MRAPSSIRRVLVVAAAAAAVFALAAAPAEARPAQGGCSQGDKACHCKAIGGEWRPQESVLAATCRVYYEHQGRKRWANVYLPSGYDGKRTYPLWTHLHGVFWSTMGGVDKQVSRRVDGSEIIPVWDQTLKLFGDQAVIVYPQSTGDPNSRQFFNVQFWQCSVGVCVDRSVDDVGFLEKVIADLPGRLAVNKGQHLLSGESSGGMMVHTLLCQSSSVPAAITAAADLLGGIGSDFAASKCGNSPAVPFLKMHGMKDPFITYDRQILVDGVNFLSSIEATQLRAARNGCGSKSENAGPRSDDGQQQCTDLCANKAGAPAAKVCGMTNVAHDTDHPWPGFVYQQSWKFFNDQLARSGRRL